MIEHDDQTASKAPAQYAGVIVITAIVALILIRVTLEKR